MNINVLCIFPEIFSPFVDFGIVGRAQSKDLLTIKLINIRDFATDSYRTVDDYPFGGGAGMIMKVDIIVKALDSIDEKSDIYLLSPRGRIFNQDFARELSKKGTITLICGRYKGVDERVRDFVDGEISIGDYVLSGGELASMVIIEALARLLPGAVGNSASVEGDSFESGLLDSPRYTRPGIFRGKEVPSVLLSGNHKEIERWREEEALKITKRYRPDLLMET